MGDHAQDTPGLSRRTALRPDLTLRLVVPVIAVPMVPHLGPLTSLLRTTVALEGSLLVDDRTRDLIGPHATGLRRNGSLAG